MSAHDFGGGANSDEIAFDPPSLITLQWADPLGGSGNDFDLFLFDATLTNLVAFSTNVQNGTQDAVETISSLNVDDTGNRLVVVLKTGSGRFLHLNTHRGRLSVATNGQIFGHPAAKRSFAVGAVNVAPAGGGPFTGGATDPIEFFSSDGPRRIFFNADGSPVVAAEGFSSILRPGRSKEEWLFARLMRERDAGCKGFADAVQAVPGGPVALLPWTVALVLGGGILGFDQLQRLDFAGATQSA